jgi:hypothetical protein
MYIFLHQYAYA